MKQLGKGEEGVWGRLGMNQFGPSGGHNTFLCMCVWAAYGVLRKHASSRYLELFSALVMPLTLYLPTCGCRWWQRYQSSVHRSTCRLPVELVWRQCVPCHRDQEGQGGQS